ncbi:MAG: amino acid ABC transporter permease [Clostridiales bacterium]|nr:amino acid ABC transporter permease [Clostridiales bacterium]
MVYKLSEGMLESIKIYTLTLIFSLPLGLIVALCRMSKNWLLRNFTKLYISIMRGTPLILQLMVVYFGPYYIFKITLPRGYRFIAVIIGFVFNYAAYFGEIYRGGIESIDSGQYDAAKVLGYNKAQTFMRIILPQVIKRVLPSITNEVITLIKDTSLAFAISYPEMFTVAKAISAAQTTMLPFVTAGIFYYIFNLLVAYTMEWIEKKMSVYR